MTDTQDLLGVLRQTHDLHIALATPLTAEQLRIDSYDSDWLVSSLLSHMGSQAEIMDLFVTASTEGGEAPGRESFDAVWDRWNAMSPEEQREGSIAANNAHVSLLQSLSDEQLDAVDIPFFGEIDGAELVRIRLAEYAVHLWDLDVTFNPTAGILPAAVPPLLSQLGRIAGRYKFEGAPFSVQVHTTMPEWSAVISFGEAIELREGKEQADAVLRLPAEALIRLVYGRLDEAHTSTDVEIIGTKSLDDLRGVFVGF